MATIINKKRYSELKPVFLLIEHIPYSVIKGEALSLLAYGNIGNRYSSDVDILVPRGYIEPVKIALRSCGFVSQNSDRFEQITAVSFSHQSIPYYKISDHVLIDVDINHDLFWGEYTGKRIDISTYLSDTMEMNIYGCRVKTLSPIKTMVQLILHTYKDMNSIYLLATRKRIKLDMFKDIFFLLKRNHDTISIDRLYSISEEYEIIPYVYYVLYYTGQVFDYDLIHTYTNAFRTPEGEALLGYYGLTPKERKEWKCDFRTRLNSDNTLNLIMKDLTKDDFEKIKINKRVFGDSSSINHQIEDWSKKG